MNDRPSIGVAAFVWKDDKFLMIQRTGAHGPGTWSVPGGHLEYGESFAGCAAREVSEETDMVIGSAELLAITNDLFPEADKHSVTVWVKADWVSGEPKIMEPNKMLDLRWSTFQDLPGPLFEPCWKHLRETKPELFS